MRSPGAHAGLAKGHPNISVKSGLRYQPGSSPENGHDAAQRIAARLNDLKTCNRVV
jgi:hypothetical protein